MLGGDDLSRLRRELRTDLAAPRAVLERLALPCAPPNRARWGSTTRSAVTCLSYVCAAVARSFRALTKAQSKGGHAWRAARSMPLQEILASDDDIRDVDVALRRLRVGA